MKYRPRRMKCQWEGETSLSKKTIIGLVVALIALAILGILKFQSERFRANTFIQGVECSYLTTGEALEKLQEAVKQQEITFQFIGDIQYQTTGEQFGLNISTETEEIANEIQSFLEFQKSELKQEQYHYFFANPIKVDEEMVRQYLKTIPELQSANMVKPQNAYLDWDEDGFLTIVPEIYGNEINFEEAVVFVIKQLEKGWTEVDFGDITYRTPEILSSDERLQTERDILNTVLHTEIRYELYDGTIFTLEPERVREWVEKNAEGHYFINFEENARSFLEELNDVASKANSKIIFHPIELEEMTLSVPKRLRAKVDIDKELELIQENLMQGETLTREPIYVRIFDARELISYIEIDLSRQRVLMYYMGECIVDTLCVTGNVKAGNATPPGLFYLSYKTRNATLMNNSFVKYWMPFNGGIGLHDASWRSTFGGEIYKTNGSHGCVNLPEEAAKIIYEHIDTTMPIIVYAS